MKGKISSKTLLLIILVIAGCGQLKISTFYEKGAVVTASEAATEIGLDILKQGGNSFDAAVAVGFALAVVYPEGGNVGGGGFALLRSVETEKIYALDFREVAPAAATTNMYLTDSGEVIENLSTLGALSSGVPGTVAGLYEIWQKFGSLRWEKLVEPAAKLAENGFVVSESLHKSITKHKDDLSIFEETKKVFLRNDEPPQTGDSISFEDLATTLYAILENGADGFYTGITADKIVQTMEKYGGLITKKDLADYKVQWREPVKFMFDSLEIYSMPPPSSGGLIVGQILKMIESYDLTNQNPDSPEFVHIFCEISKLAFADRSLHLGDPDFYNIPSAMLDSNYLNSRKLKINSNYAVPSEEILPGNFRVTESDATTHVSICDKDGNMIALTYTINSEYGSKLVVEGAGFLLNNEMDDFSVKPGVPNYFGLIGGEANKVEPNKKMLSSMSPTLIMEEGQPHLILGSRGGSKIITTIAQAIINKVRFNLRPEEIVAFPRFHHQWIPDKLYLEEESFGIDLKQELIKRGHNVTERSRYGGLNIIYIENGMMIPASDPRGDGSAAGF